MHPYRPHNFEYETGASTSGAMLFVGLLAAIILAAIVWGSYSTQTTGGMNAPEQTRTLPAQPQTPSTVPPGG